MGSILLEFSALRVPQLSGGLEITAGLLLKVATLQCTLGISFSKRANMPFARSRRAPSLSILSATIAAAGLLLFAPGPANAGRLLDYIRNYDLNDYALGIAYSTSQSPYAGSANSTIAYPYLTSFQHSAFTNDWLLLRDENFGLRFVWRNDWEFGLIARLRTLGQGVSGNDQLAGIEDRNWALEAGPLIGWRGWPVNVHLRSYWELPNRHSGSTTELEFSLPRKFGRGFFVPAVKLAYMDSGYTNYYFGVSEQEATLTRPTYRPGSATNVRVGFTLGYDLSPRWLLKGSIGLEHLDSSISASPIIERDRVWSGSLGLAYNADVFAPREDSGLLADRAVEIRLGAFNSAISTTVTRDPGDGQGGDEVDLEDLLGVADRETLFQIDARIRLGYYHRLHLGYFRLSRESQPTLGADLRFGDQVYPAGTEIESTVESSLLRFAYSYSIFRDPQKELGVMAGLSYIKFDSMIREAGTQEPERLSAEAPLPTVGAFATVSFTEKWNLSADANVFALDFDRYSGFMSYLTVGVERRFGKSFAAGLGYNFYSLRLNSKDEDLGGKLDLRYHGPKLYASVAF
jgi:outer membrane protein